MYSTHRANIRFQSKTVLILSIFIFYTGSRSSKNVTKYEFMMLTGEVLAALLLVGDHAFLDHLRYLHGEPRAEPEGHGVRDAEFGSVSEGHFNPVIHNIRHSWWVDGWWGVQNQMPDFDSKRPGWAQKLKMSKNLYMLRLVVARLGKRGTGD